jgi:hypothetical protein
MEHRDGDPEGLPGAVAGGGVDVEVAGPPTAPIALQDGLPEADLAGVGLDPQETLRKELQIPPCGEQIVTEGRIRPKSGRQVLETGGRGPF